MKLDLFGYGCPVDADKLSADDKLLLGLTGAIGILAAQNNNGPLIEALATLATEWALTRRLPMRGDA